MTVRCISLAVSWILISVAGYSLVWVTHDAIGDWPDLIGKTVSAEDYQSLNGIYHYISADQTE